MFKQQDIDLDRVYAGDRVEKAEWLPSRGVQRKATMGAHWEQHVRREGGPRGLRLRRHEARVRSDLEEETN